MDGVVQRGKCGDGRRVRAHAGGAGRAPLRVRQPRLLGAVRLRQRAGPGGPRAGRGRVTGGDGLLARGGGDPRKSTARWSPSRPGRATRAVELFEEVGRWLGIGLANLAAALDPGMFVIGGGVSDAGELLLAPARDAFRRTLTGRGFRPVAPIVRPSSARGRPGRRGRPGPGRGDLAAPGPRQDDRRHREDSRGPQPVHPPRTSRCKSAAVVLESRCGCRRRPAPRRPERRPPGMSDEPNDDGSKLGPSVNGGAAGAVVRVHRWGDPERRLRGWCRRARWTSRWCRRRRPGGGPSGSGGRWRRAWMRYVVGSARNAILVADGTDLNEPRHWPIWRPSPPAAEIHRHPTAPAAPSVVTLRSARPGSPWPPATLACTPRPPARTRTGPEGLPLLHLLFLLLGDLNENADGPVWKRLAEEGLTDLGADAGPTFSSTNPHKRIDGAHLSPARTGRILLISATREDLAAPSDHLPQLIELTA